MKEIKLIGWNGSKWLPVEEYVQKYKEYDGSYFPQQLSAKLVDGSYVKFDPNTASFPVRQYTGLKDKNGVEIYEGNIMAANPPLHEYPAKVFWNDDEARWSLESTENISDLSDFWAGHALNLEVIGNIYENPELLS